MRVSRREWLRLGTGAGAVWLLDGLVAHEQLAAVARTGIDTVLRAGQAAQITKPIPASGERIPVIGLGSAQTFNLAPGNNAYAEAQEVIRLFRELGGTVIDSSPTYQRSEQFVGETIRQLGIQNDVFIATKVNVGSAGRATAAQQMEDSLRTYGRNSIDLIQVWNLGGSIRELSAATLREHMEVLQEWKRAGRIRYLGITTSRDPQYGDVEAAMRDYTLDFVQLDYSIGDRIPEQRLLPLAQERRIAVLVNRPFTTGNLFGRVRGRSLPDFAAEFDCSSWAQYFLKFVISHPAVTCAIPATSDPAHLRDNMGAGLGRLPDERLRRAMTDHFATI
ncbi:MAG: aldo/keto reductase [Gemmatimonadetes bacterium]|nr:aldo/keto reductase [Gemmatimonadota bacterium]